MQVRRAALSLLLLLSACEGQIGNAPNGLNAPNTPGGATGSTTGANRDPTRGGNRADGGDPTSPSVETPSPSTRFARLSHEQWESTAQDLLRLGQAPGLARNFLQD